MSTRAIRVLTYLLLAVVCYAIAMAAGVRAAFAVFVVAGGICELLFWKELLWPARR